MSTLFYLEIIPNIQSSFYENALLEWAKENLPEVNLYSWDNLSDSVLIHHANELLQQSKRVLLVVEVRSAEAGTGNLISFLEEFIVHPEAYALLMGDMHPIIERMFTLLPPSKVFRAQEVQAAQPVLASVLLP